MSLESDYRIRIERDLEPICKPLQDSLRKACEEMDRIDSISVRAKSPDRFMAKAHKTNADGSLKYSEPLHQIQDQLGARVVVFFRQDVQTALTLIHRYFRPIESQPQEPLRAEEFSYFGYHLILFLPDDILPDSDFEPKVFELQIKTLFQHAWSQGNHDVGYKPTNEISDHHRRLLACAAAQAWGADEIFSRVVEELS